MAEAFGSFSGVYMEAGRTLGSGPTRTLFRVNLPIMGPTLRGAALVAVIDIVQDLPLTTILRPFDFPTLAVETFRLAGDERLAESSIMALLRATAISKTFTRPCHQALRELSLEVHADEVLAIVGESGSGKTTAGDRHGVPERRDLSTPDRSCGSVSASTLRRSDSASRDRAEPRSHAPASHSGRAVQQSGRVVEDRRREGGHRDSPGEQRPGDSGHAQRMGGVPRRGRTQPEGIRRSSGGSGLSRSAPSRYSPRAATENRSARPPTRGPRR